MPRRLRRQSWAVASQNGRTVDAAFLDAFGSDGKLDRKNDGFGAGFEHPIFRACSRIRLTHGGGNGAMRRE